MSYNEKKVLYNKQWRQLNKEKIRQYSRNSRKNETLEQRQHRLKKSKEYKETHKKEIKLYAKEYVKEFKETHGVTIDAHYYLKNKAKRNQACKAYKNRNKEKITKYRKKYKEQRYKARMLTDPLFCAKEKLRSAIRRAFQRIKKNKPTNTEKLLGCLWEEAKAHMENLWTEGMSWQNHGAGDDKWQIDHIRPVVSFAEHELDQMNLITNLQPLWMKDNLVKRDKY
jgi:hypothetical protein